MIEGKKVKKANRAIDMINDKPLKAIVLFSLPLLLGNILQQLYNTVDSIVLGQFVGSSALAAVGTSGPITNLLIAFFIGISSGASISVSHALGAKDSKKLNNIVHSILFITCILGLLLAVLGILLSRPLLQMLNTPAEIIVMANEYMVITFVGIIFLMLYNVINGIFQGMGNSKTPLFILLISSIINVVLDLLFVAVFHMGIGGAAIATVIAQMVSVIYGIIKLNAQKNGLHISFKNLRLDKKETKKILHLGMPTGFQNSLQSVGNILVQGIINSFGTVVMAANIAVIKIDSFCTMPMMTFATAMTVYTGQNFGANRKDRINKGLKDTLLLFVILSLGISLFVVKAGPALLHLFTKDEAVVQAGMDKIYIIAPFYVCLGLFGLFAGVIRGSGQTLVPMLIGITTMFIGRVPVAHFLSQKIGANGIHWSLSVQWAAEAILIIGYYFFYHRKKIMKPI